MPKKKKGGRHKAAKKTNGDQNQDVQPVTQEESQMPKGSRMLRAIRVTPRLLEAAKAYKQATGTSFYALGLQAITERLVKEGYLKESD